MESKPAGVIQAAGKMYAGMASLFGSMHTRSDNLLPGLGIGGEGGAAESRHARLANFLAGVAWLRCKVYINYRMNYPER